MNVKNVMKKIIKWNYLSFFKEFEEVGSPYKGGETTLGREASYVSFDDISAEIGRPTPRNILK